MRLLACFSFPVLACVSPDGDEVDATVRSCDASTMICVLPTLGGVVPWIPTSQVPIYEMGFFASTFLLRST